MRALLLCGGILSLACGSDGGSAGSGESFGGSSSGGETAGGSAGLASGGSANGGSAGNETGGSGASSGTGGASSGGSGAGGGGAGGSAGSAPCTTRITYGSSWIHGSSHPNDYDVANGVVTWDGSCQTDGSGNAYATLSNGWKPYFQGKSCVIALDYADSCSGVPTSCETRIGYGSAWLPGPNHPNSYDDVKGVVTWDGVCSNSGGNSSATLSNGWTPTYSGSSACDLAFRHTQCGGLFANPVVDVDCPDPGVMRDGDTYYMACTPGPKYPMRSSKDLVHWQREGNVFTDATKPSWGTGSFWAPELHKVGSSYVVYFSAKSSTSGTFAIGAASAASPTGPYTDIGKPLITEPSPGAIDAHYFRASTGKHYVLWKVDGNAVGQSTPIKIQELAADGLSVVGSAKTLISNTESWEGALVEGPWMIEHGGEFFLFYSANGYASSKYAIGVAKASSPTGPFTKRGSPILVSKGAWAGPGHGSVVKGPSGDWVHVYHAWVAGKIQQSPGRVVLVDRIQWQGGWPLMRGAPSSRSQPLP
ncbi:MAG: glycoside hydrolase family 43 protein [Polyangiaceae bacterium]